MDLVAFAQIDDLEKIAKDNNIDVPRLRGYRLMKNEESVTSEELRRLMKNCEVDVCKELCCSDPFWNANTIISCFNDKTDSICDKYLLKDMAEDGYSEYVGVKWDKIHGWKRKVLKFAIKQEQKRIKDQYAIWNKYVGKENVLYIHARIGGANWEYYDGKELEKQPWFLEKVDDCWDCTYCDIYALVK